MPPMYLACGKTLSQARRHGITTVQVLKVPEGEWVLQNAAGSALGRQLVAVAKHRGIKTINLVSAC